MQPLDELLDRIKWDAEFGKGAFALGYYDRVLRRELVVPLARVAVVEGTLTFEDEEGTTRTIPFHRVRVVYRNGVVIWRRPDRATPGPRTSPGRLTATWPVALARRHASGLGAGENR